MKNTAVFLLIMMAVLLASCTADSKAAEEAKLQTERPDRFKINILEELDLSENEALYLNELQERGSLRIATRETGARHQSADETASGMNYSLLKSFADDAGLRLEVVVVDSIEAYFMKDGKFNTGVKDDPKIAYKPDLFEEVDIYADMLTQLPWREKLMRFIGFVPIRELVVHRQDESLSSIRGLKGKTAAVQTASSYMTTLSEIDLQYGLDIQEENSKTIGETLSMVSEGNADFTIIDSNRAFLEVRKYDNLTAGIPVTDVKYVGWAVARDNAELASILRKYIDAMLVEGQFNDVWIRDYDISFHEYYTLILKNSGTLSVMNLTAEELEYLQEIRERGYLSIAAQDIVTGYRSDQSFQTGYNYLLAEHLADSLGVELKVTLVDQFTKYFWSDGETPEEIKIGDEYYYKPDLLETVDIYCDNLTHLPWRAQILNQIEGATVRNVLVQKKGSGIRRIEDIDGLRVAINKDTAYESALGALKETYGLNVSVVEVYSEEGAFMAMEKGLADVTIVDSDIGFVFLKTHKDFEIVLPVSDVAFVGWAVAKDNEMLASILTKYFDTVKRNGLFDEYWSKTYEITYAEYMRLLID